MSIALTLNVSNLYGYYKCKVGSKESLATVTSNFFRKQIVENAVKIVAKQASNPAANNPDLSTQDI